MFKHIWFNKKENEGNNCRRLENQTNNSSYARNVHPPTDLSNIRRCRPTYSPMVNEFRAHADKKIRM